MVRCAVCLNELVSGRDQFRFEDVFVVHLRCVGGMPKIRIEYDRLVAEVQQLRASSTRAAAGLQAMLDRAEGSERVARVGHNQAMTDLAAARAELAAERSRRTSLELQLELARGAPVAEKLEPPGSDATPISGPQKSDGEIRATLLELD